MKTKYPQEFKQGVVASYTEGTPVLILAREHGIPRSTIYVWINQLAEIRTIKTKKLTATAREVKHLRDKVKRLLQENEILKKAENTMGLTQKEKLRVISKLEGEYPVRVICRAFGVLHSTYYHYKLRRPNQTQIERDDLILRPEIKDIFELTKGRIGSKKIKIMLEKRGYFISSERVRRLLDELGLICRSRKRNFHYNYSKSSRSRKDLVKQNFKQTEPNKVWVSDITYIRVNYKPYYLCTVIDLFSRKVIGHNVLDNQDTELVISAFKMAYTNRSPKDDLIFHSDQGMQYTSNAFKDILKDKKIKQSFSRAGCPYDNAVAESFFRTLKQDEVNHFYYKTPNELIDSINEFIYFFNEIRPHKCLNNLTPNEFELNYFNNLKQ